MRRIPTGHGSHATPAAAALACVIIWCGGCRDMQFPGVGPTQSARSASPAPPRTPPPVQRVGPLRAVWVTRFDFRSAEDIRQVMADCKAMGLNAVMFQVRGNGTAFYRSNIEPWATELGGKDPGFDPLEVAVREAHEHGIELHAWANVMPGWRGPNPPSDPRQLYNAHPNWFWYDQKGIRQPLIQVDGGRRVGWYVSVNPCLPEVRRYLVDVFREIAANYDVDGLHIDYIRFPREASPRGSDYPRDRQTLALYKRETGRTPDENAAAWAQWRADQVSAIVRETRVMLRQVRPSAELSAAVAPDPVEAKRSFYQDAEVWTRNDWVDILVPMDYTTSLDEFTRRANAWKQRAHGVPVAVGMGVYMHKSADDVACQLDLAQKWGQGFCLFSYASLYSAPGRLTASGERVRTRLRGKMLAWTSPFAGE